MKFSSFPSRTPYSWFHTIFRNKLLLIFAYCSLFVVGTLFLEGLYEALYQKGTLKTLVTIFLSLSTTAFLFYFFNIGIYIRFYVKKKKDYLKTLFFMIIFVLISLSVSSLGLIHVWKENGLFAPRTLFFTIFFSNIIFFFVCLSLATRLDILSRKTKTKKKEKSFKNDQKKIS